MFTILVYFYMMDDSLLRLDRSKFWSAALGILLLSPLVPIILTIVYLVTRNEKIHERATLSKFMAGFLDHGPHFVLRLVVVVLIGLAQGGSYHRDDFIFIFSMFTSFLAFILTTLWFNERSSSFVKWIFLSGPMYSALFACRAFTLAVFLKETLYNNKSDAPWAFFILFLMISFNVLLLRHCGQDWLRSGVFGVTSILVPSGYNNDSLYYQLPNQDITKDQNNVYTVHNQNNDEAGQDEPSQEKIVLTPMKSTKFFILHVLFNTILMFGISVFLFTTSSSLDSNSDDALVIPQILGVVPGLLFSIANCFTLAKSAQVQGEGDVEVCCGRMKKGGLVCLAVVFTILGFISLVPALFWTILYKWFTSLDVTKAMVDYAKSD